MRTITSKEILAAKNRMLDNIITVLNQENAKDLSDETFENSFKNRCGYGPFLTYAKEFREEGILTLDHIKHSFLSTIVK